MELRNCMEIMWKCGLCGNNYEDSVEMTRKYFGSFLELTTVVHRFKHAPTYFLKVYGKIVHCISIWTIGPYES